jgi:hypothetical protein
LELKPCLLQPLIWSLRMSTPGLSPTVSVKKLRMKARHQWLIPIILATREAEIRRMGVQSQPRQIV